MTYRGRLIWPHLARIARLDPTAIAADPDAGGPLTSGYDPDFREIVRLPDNAKVTGPSARLELATIDLPVQVEDQEWEQLRMLRTGDSPQIEVTLVFHFRDLERLGYVDADTGDALVPRKGDRLVSLVNKRTDLLTEAVPTPPGLYCTEAQPRSYGLSSLRRNLLVCVFASRDTSQ
jgi:hypothetical protein